MTEAVALFRVLACCLRVLLSVCVYAFVEPCVYSFICRLALANLMLHTGNLWHTAHVLQTKEPVCPVLRCSICK